jgi:hypothetical protein
MREIERGARHRTADEKVEMKKIALKEIYERPGRRRRWKILKSET